jgi:hypothetical protein
VGDTRLLTGFSINSEHFPDIFSEPRGCVLRASEENLIVRLRLKGYGGV